MLGSDLPVELLTDKPQITYYPITGLTITDFRQGKQPLYHRMGAEKL